VYPWFYVFELVPQPYHLLGWLFRMEGDRRGVNNTREARESKVLHPIPQSLRFI
jgi:hypothetical protein